MHNLLEMIIALPSSRQAKEKHPLPRSKEKVLSGVMNQI
jgi:hypothetical protein